jgi:hypothetical protein
VIAALMLLPLSAFGGRGAWSAWTFCACSVACALAVGLRLGGALDRCILLLTGALALQVLPLPASVVDLLSPHVPAVESALSLAPLAEGSFQTLSIEVRSTLWGGVVWLGAVALFWAARSQFPAGGLRQTARIIAGMGLAVSLLAIAQAASAGRSIYWVFPTDIEGPLPFGPFVNRNHFATWAIMALPLTLGYIAAHTCAHAATAPAGAHLRARLAQAIDPRTAWLALAAGIMLVALLLSLSRSGLLALGASGLVAMWAARGALEAGQRRWTIAAILSLALFGAFWSDVPALARRVASVRTSVADRVTIWRETIPVIRDFPLTGTGAGTYQTAMFVYQQADRGVFFNQAHNHYLQVAAEGGWLLVVPASLGVAALILLARRRIRDDRSGLRWIRLGAACGLAAAALQSVWETGLVMPANAALAAVLAAMAVHARDQGSGSGIGDDVSPSSGVRCPPSHIRGNPTTPDPDVGPTLGGQPLPRPGHQPVRVEERERGA